MKVWTVIAFLGALTSCASFAQDVTSSAEQRCTSVDVRTGPKGFLFREPSDQGSIGWCYAYVAADLISFKLGKQVSPLYLAYETNKTYSDSIFRKFLAKLFDPKSAVIQGGFFEDPIKIFNANGVCSEEHFPSNQSFFGLNSPIVNILSYWREQDRKDGPSQPVETRCKNINDIYGVIKRIIPGLDAESFASVFIKNSDQDMENFLSSLAEASCKPENILRSPDKIEILDAGQDSRNQMEVMDSQLMQGNPVGIGYSTKRFVQGLDGRHASVVIGRRWKNGVCQYLIRNSWGKTCSPYRSETTECEEQSGAYWVSRKDLSASLIKVEYIQ